MKALITGISGFVGRHLAEHLLEHHYEVAGTTRGESAIVHIGNKRINVYHCDFADEMSIYRLLSEVNPDVVFHLAGQSNVKRSWEDREGTFYANVNQSIFLLDACVKFQQQHPAFRLLTVGSAEEYGKVEPSEQPITEQTPLRPMSPYGASKAALSMLVGQYFKTNGLQVIHARPFNHIGPGQRLGFVVPDFASQIAGIEKGIREPVLRVGNLEAVRDFTDVRDIVVAYRLLAQKGEPGEIYNVCSGQGRSIRSLLDSLIRLSTKQIDIVLDEERLRPSEVPVFVGSNEKIKRTLQWKPVRSLEQTLQDILAEHRNQPS